MKKIRSVLGGFFLFIFFINTSEGSYRELPLNQSRSYESGAAVGNNMALLGQRLSDAIQENALRKKRFNLAYSRLLLALQDYSRENHKKHMDILAKFPDLSYSLKIGLIPIYDQYRQDRDNLDLVYNKFYQKIIAVEISEEDEIAIEDLFRLTLYMDPHEDRKMLTQEIEYLSLPAYFMKTMIFLKNNNI